MKWRDENKKNTEGIMNEIKEINKKIIELDKKVSNISKYLRKEKNSNIDQFKVFIFFLWLTI